jgi:ribosomal protein RSM22 (predicted rRNA methylase)
VILPGDLNAALAAWMADNGAGSLGAKAKALQTAYRKGETSSQVDVAAYMATRVPATFEANMRVQQAFAEAMPQFAPRSVLDVGAGPGVATWAALRQWPMIEQVIQCERDADFARALTTLNGSSGLDTLSAATLLQITEKQLQPDVTADLVIASYVLAELPLETMADVVTRLWTRTSQVLVLIEPGTPQGFARLKVARQTLLRGGACVVAPCTHQNVCPMSNDDWCHFKTRVQRSREHMHAKQAVVPFEDEAFSYLVVARHKVVQSAARIVAPLVVTKAGVSLKLCSAQGLSDVTVASRDKATYKRAKKKTWGQVWE